MDDIREINETMKSQEWRSRFRLPCRASLVLFQELFYRQIVDHRHVQYYVYISEITRVDYSQRFLFIHHYYIYIYSLKCNNERWKRGGGGGARGVMCLDSIERRTAASRARCVESCCIAAVSCYYRLYIVIVRSTTIPTFYGEQKKTKKKERYLKESKSRMRTACSLVATIACLWTLEELNIIGQ